MGQVLLVEDEVLIAEMIEEALEDRGFEVRSAHTDTGAYDILAGEARAFEVLIADVNLGSGDSGFEVARRARELHPGLKVIYITGHAAHLERLGVTDGIMFPKPFYPEELVDRVAALLDSRATVGRPAVGPADWPAPCATNTASSRPSTASPRSSAP